MLRKALTLGMIFIFTLSLLAVSMITCFTYDAEAMMGADDFGTVDIRPGHSHWDCVVKGKRHRFLHAPKGVDCFLWTQ